MFAFSASSLYSDAMVFRRLAILMVLTLFVPVLLCSQPFVERYFPAKQRAMDFEPQLSVHMASAQVVVVSFTDGFQGLETDPLASRSSDWSINGKEPLAVHHASASVNELPKQKDGSYPVERRYSLFLELEGPLENLHSYAIDGPFGALSFVFDEKKMFNESIKVNQVGYHPDSMVRYANLGIFLGDGGSRKVAPDLPYFVLDENDRVVYSGRVAYRGDDTEVGEDTISSGEYVYRLDLAEVPPGGPYRIHIPQWGVSHPFSISYEAVDTIATTYLRGLYHQRCGTALTLPYTRYEREACHTEAALTRTSWETYPAIEVTKADPIISISGGHHDAGDFDRRPYHTVVPIMLLGYLEAFPSHFLDGQASIPESGNGLPDLLDEALWAIRGWESLQITDSTDPSFGMVMAGTEANGHPEYGVVQADTDTLKYGTWDVDDETTLYVAGMMAHASRLLTGYGPSWQARSRELYEKSLLAWEASHENATQTTAHLYASLQLFLASPPERAPEFHQAFADDARFILIEDGSWPEQYRPGNIRATCHTFHFSSYLLANKDVDETLQDALVALVFEQAEQGGYMGFSAEEAFYPQGVTKSYGWGAATAQGRYADVHAFAYRLAETEEEKARQFAILSQYSDYALGLNPLGMSFVTGLGSVQPASPLHLDSWPAIERGLGPVPGILIYGPSSERSNADYQKVVSDTLYPVWENMPQQRRWADGWSLVNNNEFTIWETMVWNIALSGVLNTHPVSGR